MVNVKQHAHVWDEILLILKDQISSYAYKNWFRESTVLLSVNGHQVEIGIPNGTYKNVIKNKFGNKVQKCCEIYLGHHVTLSYTVYGKLAQFIETKNYSEQKDNSKSSAAVLPAKSQSRLSNGYARLIKKVRKDDIIIGGYNKIAVSAVKSIINGDSDCPNPLFIYGETGMGKTLLLQMAYHELVQSEKGKNVICTSCEAFMNDYISSLRNGSIEKFRNHFRNTDVFLIDDIHFLGKGVKKSTKEEFYHTVNTLLNAGKQVVVTCDKHPTTVEEIGPEIVNLMMGGMWVQLARPDKEMRIEILKKISKGQAVSEDVYDYIASHYSQDIRELTGALTTVLSFCKYAEKPCTISIVKKALGSHTKHAEGPSIGFKQIVSEVCNYLGIENAKIFSNSRSRQVVTARHIAIYLCNTYMKDASLGELGVMFNNSRPAVLYAGNKVARAIKENDRIIAPAVRSIRKKLEAAQ